MICPGMDISPHSNNMPWHSRSSVTTQLWSALACIRHHIAIICPGIVDWSSRYWYLLPLHDCAVCVYLALTWQISRHASAWWDWWQDLSHETWKSLLARCYLVHIVFMPLGQFDKRCSKQSAQKDHEFDSSTGTKKWRDLKKSLKNNINYVCTVNLVYHSWLTHA